MRRNINLFTCKIWGIPLYPKELKHSLLLNFDLLPLLVPFILSILNQYFYINFNELFSGFLCWVLLTIQYSFLLIKNLLPMRSQAKMALIYEQTPPQWVANLRLRQGCIQGQIFGPHNPPAKHKHNSTYSVFEIV